MRVSEFQTSDGKRFPTKEQHDEHEDDLTFQQVAGCKLEDVHAAIAGREPRLAAAFEVIGGRCAKGRYERGELRRVKKPKAS